MAWCLAVCRGLLHARRRYLGGNLIKSIADISGAFEGLVLNSFEKFFDNSLYVTCTTAPSCHHGGVGFQGGRLGPFTGVNEPISARSRQHRDAVPCKLPVLTPTVPVLLWHVAWCVADRYLQDNLITSVPRGAFEGLGKVEHLCVTHPTPAAPRADGSVVQRWRSAGLGFAQRAALSADSHSHTLPGRYPDAGVCARGQSLDALAVAHRRGGLCPV